MRWLLPLVPVLTMACTSVVSFDEYSTSPDLAPVGSPPLAITVRGVREGTTVVFHNEAGIVLAQRRAGYDRTVTAAVAASLVTVEWDDSSLVTFAGVRPGESLVAAPERSIPRRFPVNVVLPRAGNGAPYIYALEAFGDPPIDGTYGDDSVLQPFALTVPLGSNDTFTLLALARDSAGTLVRCLVARDLVAGKAGAFASLPAGKAGWEEPEIVSVYARSASAPPSADRATDLLGVVDERIGRPGCATVQSSSSPTSNQYYVARAFERDLVASAELSWRDGLGRHGLKTVARSPMSGLSFSLDSELDVPSAELDLNDPAAPSVRWSGAPETSAGAIVTVTSITSVPPPDAIRTWTFLEPGSSARRVRPRLPAALEARTPAWGPRSAMVRVEVYERGAVPDVAALRRHWEADPRSAPPRGTMRSAFVEVP